MEKIILLIITIEICILLYILFHRRTILPAIGIYFGYTRIVYIDFLFGNRLVFRSLIDYRFEFGIGENIYLIITHIGFLVMFALFSVMHTNKFQNPKWNIATIFYLVLFIFICFDGQEYLTKSREEIRQAVTLVKAIRRNILFYLIPILIFNDQMTRSKRFVIVSYLVIVLLSKEREPLLLLSLVIFYNYIRYMKPVLTILGSIIAGVALLYWKAIYIWYSLRSYNLFDSLKASNLELSRSEPMLPFITSIKIIEGDWLMHFPDLTYISGVFWQLLRVVTAVDYPSLSELNSIYVSNGKYGAAFSGIGESYLNFGVLGPVLLIVGLFLFMQFLSSIVGKRASYVIGSLMAFKLMRTELALILKLQILPLILTILIIKYVIKRSHSNL